MASLGTISWQKLRLDILQIATTFVIALTAGYICLQINLPAPYMMGSLFGLWITGANIPKLQPYLGVARWFHKPVVLGLGVLIGATFNQDVISQFSSWQITIAMMIVTTIFVTAIGYLFLTRFRKYEPNLALLCSVPGGQAEVLTVAKDITNKDYVVALFHLVRVVIVFVSTPFLLAVIEGQQAVADSNIALQALPSLFNLETRQLFIFISLAICGFYMARLLRLPIPHLLGPLFLSSLCHGIGWVELPRVNEFVILAQLTIGGAIGARLSRVPVKEVIEVLKDAIANTVLLLSAYILAAIAASYLLGTKFLSVWLAFVPGGLYEVTLLAVIFGFDVAFVAIHHTVRIILVILCLPLLAMKFMRKTS